MQRKKFYLLCYSFMKKFLIFSLLWISSFSVIFAYNLKITEVLVDGTDEFVEISNLSNNPFVGTLLLSGAKSTILSFTNLSLAPWSSFIAGDGLSMFSSFAGFSVKTGLSLNFGDT